MAPGGQTATFTRSSLGGRVGPRLLKTSMPGKDQIPNSWDATVPDAGPFATKPPPLPPEATIIDSRTKSDAATQPITQAVGSFTTSISIPAPFLSAGSRGTRLRLVPLEHLRGKASIELYFKSGETFFLGRSSEADWVSCFFPRSDKNDQRSKRLSKLHARLEFRGGKLWLRRAGSAALHIGGHEVGADPTGLGLREQDQIVLSEDYALEIFYDISLQGTLHFTNGGRIQFNPTLLGAVRFEPINSALGYRNSCWLFVDVGFGSARGGVLTAGAELAPQQGVILMIGGCFWILNLVNNEKVAVNDYRIAANEIVPLTQGDSVWLGAIRYRAEIS
jgi:hypothetical protein